MKHDAFITKWVLDTVKEKYPDDIALVLAHSTLNIDDEPVISYFIPITDKGRQFAQTFILGGRGYDIWGIEWERMEQFAALEEYNHTVLADAEILYTRTPEDAERFYALQKKQAENLLSAPLARRQALECYATAKSLYEELFFAEGGDIPVYAGHVIIYLAKAVAFLNHRYFKHSQAEQAEELFTMEKLPDGFTDCYKKVIASKEKVEIIALCKEMIGMTAEMFDSAASPVLEKNFQDLADWYAELSYTWLRIRHYAKAGDVVKSYMWGITLQHELNEVCGDFGLAKMDFMADFDPDDLRKFAAKADMLEAEMRKIIAENGGIIREYNSPEEFLDEV